MTTARVSVNNGDELAVIGGTVRAHSSSQPISGAWIRVNETGRVYVTDSDGRFRIDHLPSSPHTLTVRAVGFLDETQTVRVPKPDGSYDFTLTPI